MRFSAESILEEIISIVADQATLDPSDLGAESLLRDLSLDSLSLIEVVFAIEEAFDIELPFDANNPDSGDFDISSIGSIVAAVENLVFEGKR
ncbi:MAG: phosphopantetheine-binding protein [Paracoccaceae bacterium]|nr:phosphopantetheine-binding protein [Paracoccaceae bacterium]MDE2914885.1 phosphopantetheine-binding protein [Paracoccaceae bacterium]